MARGWVVTSVVAAGLWCAGAITAPAAEGPAPVEPPSAAVVPVPACTVEQTVPEPATAAPGAGAQVVHFTLVDPACD